MTLKATTSRLFTFGYLTYQSPAKLIMPPTEDSYHVNLTMRWPRCLRHPRRPATTDRT